MAGQMEYKRLGNTGLTVSRICLGCMTFGSKSWQEWNLEEEEAIPVLKHAYDLGINFFDTANVYSNGQSEVILGNFLKKHNIDRDRVVIATKAFCQVAKDVGHNTLNQPLTGIEGANNGGLSRKHLFHAVDESLKRLQTDFIDLYQIHRWDYHTPIEETMEALHDLVKSGKVRYIGASSMFCWQFAKAQFVAEKNGWTKFVSMQDLYNLLYREEEREMIPFCKDQGVGLIPWSPLARGLLSGKKDTLRSKTDFAFTSPKWTNLRDASSHIVDRATEIATKHNATTPQVALAWVLSKSQVTAPIVGTRTIEQLDQLVAALSLKLSEEDIKYLEEPYTPREVMGHM